MTVPGTVSRGVRIALGVAGLVLLATEVVLLAREGVTPTTARLAVGAAGFLFVLALTARDRASRKKLLMGAIFVVVLTGWVALVVR